MVTFKNNSDNSKRLDLQILQNGWTSLYYQTSVLDNDLNWFKNEKYTIIEFNCTSWTNESVIHKALKRTLDFPDYYGGNLDALNDCLSDFEISVHGTIIVFRHFQTLDKKFAHCLLDIFADNSRKRMLFGQKLLTLIQVDNPKYQIAPIGSTPVLWNGAEWLDTKRNL